MSREFIAHCVKCDAHWVVLVESETVRVSPGYGDTQAQRVLTGQCPECGAPVESVMIHP